MSSFKRNLLKCDRKGKKSFARLCEKTVVHNNHLQSHNKLQDESRRLPLISHRSCFPKGQRKWENKNTWGMFWKICCKLLPAWREKKVICWPDSNKWDPAGLAHVWLQWSLVYCGCYIFKPRLAINEIHKVKKKPLSYLHNPRSRSNMSEMYHYGMQAL